MQTKSMRVQRAPDFLDSMRVQRAPDFTLVSTINCPAGTI